MVSGIVNPELRKGTVAILGLLLGQSLGCGNSYNEVIANVVNLNVHG